MLIGVWRYHPPLQFHKFILRTNANQMRTLNFSTGKCVVDTMVLTCLGQDEQMCTVGMQERSTRRNIFYLIFIANEGTVYIVFICTNACASVMCGGQDILFIHIH